MDIPHVDFSLTSCESMVSGEMSSLTSSRGMRIAPANAWASLSISLYWFGRRCRCRIKCPSSCAFVNLSLSPFEESGEYPITAALPVKPGYVTPSLWRCSAPPWQVSVRKGAITIAFLSTQRVRFPIHPLGFRPRNLRVLDAMHSMSSWLIFSVRGEIASIHSRSGETPMAFSSFSTVSCSIEYSVATALSSETEDLDVCLYVSSTTGTALIECSKNAIG